ncbi:PIN domain-containing protein [Magnetococcales bacterium HHB-1]
MVIDYTIQAEVIDLTRDTPTKEDVFLVDTNVWYWMAYSNATFHYLGLSNYTKYLNDALNASAKLFYSGLSLAELSHVIEKTEKEIYERHNRTGDIKPKIYRHNRSSERSHVVSEIKAAWAQVSNLATLLPCHSGPEMINSALAHLDIVKVDGYDLFILESMANESIKKIITDDGDFATVPGLQVFTINRNVIQKAREQNKLIERIR